MPRWPVLVPLLALLLGACAGIEPYTPPVSGEMAGPGLFTGPAGEFVLTPPATKPAPDGK